MAIRLSYIQGQPVEVKIDAPAGNLAAGEMTNIGNHICVPHAPVFTGKPAVLSHGPARYRATAETGDVPSNIGAGAKVYLSTTGTLVTSGSGSRHVGWTPAAILANATEFELILNPDGVAL